MSDKKSKTKISPEKIKTDNKPDTLTTRKKRCIVETIVVSAISLLVFLAFGYLALMSFFQTSKFDPANYGSEVVLYETDNLALNIFFTAIFTFFLFRMRKHFDFFAKVNIRVLEFVLAGFAAVIGFIWIFSVTSVPAADSYNIFEAATKAAQNDYTPFINGADFYNKDFYGGYSYFNFYPFQLGFVFFCELIYRIFGVDSSLPVQVINVLCVSAAYYAIARISALLFKRKSVEFITILLLAACIQPILLCTFVYGNIIGMCCALWASLFLIKYMQGGGYLNLIPCGLLLVLSTLVKYNNMIYLIAFTIMLIVHTIKERKWQSIAFALAICVSVVGASNLVIMSYENRAGVDLPSGVSQVMYLDMGLTESYMAPGWYTRTGLETYLNNNFDKDAAEAQAWADIDSKLENFSDADYALDFFSKKIVSQWNEPTFESIWVSKVKSHEYELGAIGTAVYDKSLGQFLELHFNFYVQILYILFAAGIYIMFIRKKLDVCTVLLPLVILGGFSYHLLFEGKSQYVLTYIPLLIPTAAYAAGVILTGKYEKLGKFVDTINRKVTE